MQAICPVVLVFEDQGTGGLEIESNPDHRRDRRGQEKTKSEPDKESIERIAEQRIQPAHDEETEKLAPDDSFDFRYFHAHSFLVFRTAIKHSNSICHPERRSERSLRSRMTKVNGSALVFSSSGDSSTAAVSE